MTRPHTDIIFSPAVKLEQARLGSRPMIERWVERGGFREDRDEVLHGFIARSNSFYLGTASADGQPYVQHRGGPQGFLRPVGGRFCGLVGDGCYPPWAGGLAPRRAARVAAGSGRTV